MSLKVEDENLNPVYLMPSTCKMATSPLHGFYVKLALKNSFHFFKYLKFFSANKLKYFYSYFNTKNPYKNQRTDESTVYVLTQVYISCKHN